MKAVLTALDTRISRNAAFKLASELGARAASLALVLLAARQLGEASFGLYNYGIALGFVVAQVADLGLQMLLTREIARRDMAARPVMRSALQLKGLLSLLVLLLLLVLTAGYEPSIRLALLTLGLMMLAQTYLEFVAYIFRGQQLLLTEARLLAAARLSMAVLGALVLWMGGDLLELALSNLLAVSLLAGFGFVRLRQAGWLEWESERAPYLPLLRQALPLGIAIVLSIAYTRLAVLLLQVRSDELFVAHFSAAQRLVEPTQIVPASMLAAVFPAYSHALRADPEGARRLAVRVALLLGVGGLLLGLLFWLLAPWLIPFLYGSAYADSIPVLQLLGSSTVLAFVNYSLTHYLIARGRQGLLGFFTGAMLLLHAVLTWLFIPRLGAVGPAISVIVAESLLFICCLFALRLAAPFVADVETSDTADTDPAGASAAV